MMVVGLLLLLLADFALYVVLGLVDKIGHIRRHGHVPMWLALTLSSLTVMVHTFATMRLLGNVTTGEEAAFAMVAFAVFGFLPVSAAVRMLIQTISNGSVDGLYGWNSPASVAAHDLSKAHQLTLNQDIVGAIREYKRCFEADPSNPDALFGAAMLFEQSNRPNEAVALYRDIICRFPKGSVAWVTAAYQLALVYEVRLDDPVTASGLLREVVRLKPCSDVGQLAQTRLNEAFTRSLASA